MTLIRLPLCHNYTRTPLIGARVSIVTTDNCSASTPTWDTDILGDEYLATSIDLGKDPDGEGEIKAIVVKHQPNHSIPSSAPAVLWVHGMSDYFFQAHVAERLSQAGYAFYALDLRKCGRAHREGQSWHHISDLSLYDAELNRAIDIIAGEGHESVSIIAHSTGGLIVSLWLDRLRRNDARRHAMVQAVILNSPWLDLHFPAWKVPVIKALASFYSRVNPHRLTPQTSSGGYGKSIHSEYKGAWSFDTRMKPIYGHQKNWQWLAAILRAQANIKKGINIGVPCLVLHSDHSILGSDYSPALDTVDAVLDVDQIVKCAPLLGKDVEIKTIPGARHDVFLSREHARALAIQETLSFLKKHATQ